MKAAQDVWVVATTLLYCSTFVAEAFAMFIPEAVHYFIILI